MNSGLAPWTFAAVCLLTTVACGGGSDSPTQPSPPPSGGGGGGAPAPSSVTITITGAGVNPANAEVAVGGTVNVVNNDSSVHEMSSDPHPVHTDCPGLNIGLLQPNQSRASQALTTARVCGMHDHLNPGTTSLQGRITVR
jgi:plastocyanin